jgi:hypothetical protein
MVDNGLIVELSAPVTAELTHRLSPGERILHQTRASASIHLPLSLRLRGWRRFFAAGAKRISYPDPTLIAALRKAHRMTERERGMPTVAASPVSPYDRRILRLAFLAPDLQREIIAGLQPASRETVARSLATDGMVRATRPVQPLYGVTLQGETSAGGEWRRGWDSNSGSKRLNSDK